MIEKKRIRAGKFYEAKVVVGRCCYGGNHAIRSVYGQVIQSSVTENELSFQDPTKTPGPPPGELGTRSMFEHPLKKPSDTSSRTPLQDLYGTIIAI